MNDIYDVIILGAGISGLAAAKVLSKEGLKVVVLEARSRHGGRIHSVTYESEDSCPDGLLTKHTVDLGASYLHGCCANQDVQPLFRLAYHLKIPTITCPGDVLGSNRGWECPEVAVWRDNMTGELVNITEIAEMNFLLDRCLIKGITWTSKLSALNINQNMNLENIFKLILAENLKMLYESGQRTSPILTPRENGIFTALFSRYIEYVNPAHRLPFQLHLGEFLERDAKSGIADDPLRPTSEEKQLCIEWYEEKLEHLTSKTLKAKIAKRVDNRSEDRLVCEGFDQFTNYLARNLDIRYSCVARNVDWSAVSPNTEQSSANNLIHVHADDLNSQSCISFKAKYCLVTLPVGVLNGLDCRSAVRFTPPLPTTKLRAISNLAIPHHGAATHNKVILVFKSGDVFWDKNAAQICCTDPRLHALNLHRFGLPGAIMFHIWGGSSLCLTGRLDSEVIMDLLNIFAGMYKMSLNEVPKPIHFWVTRWSEDPFSLGSYTAGEPGSSDVDRHAYAESLPQCGKPRILFAGEATIDSEGGQQCTHGAFLTGVHRAIDILKEEQGGNCRVKDVRIVDYITRCDSQRFPPHKMVRRNTMSIRKC